MCCAERVVEYNFRGLDGLSPAELVQHFPVRPSQLSTEWLALRFPVAMMKLNDMNCLFAGKIAVEKLRRSGCRPQEWIPGLPRRVGETQCRQPASARSAGRIFDGQVI